MPSPWRDLDAFRDRAVPKLFHLRTARRAGLSVPPTVWAPAAGVAAGADAPAGLADGPLIVRSGSPTEDTAATSNAGQFLSVVVDGRGDFPDAVRRVAAALPGGTEGSPAGVVFVQPHVRAEVAGVTFFDGFYFEETRAAGGNAALTAGLDRGEVRRGHVQRGDPHHAWLARVYEAFGGRGTLDLEWAVPAGGVEPWLLQSRPALFPLRRCQTLSLANHKEILGDPPSPWMTGTLAQVGRPVMRFFERIDPAVAGWEETYSVELGERAWMNFSAFFRMMDRWGMPRTMVTDGVGGDAAGPADARLLVGPFVKRFPVLPRLVGACLWTVAAAPRGLRRLDAELARARTLADLQAVNADALAFSVRTNFAIMSLLSGLVRIRKSVGLGQAAEVVTRRMMGEYAALAALPDRDRRLEALDAWLARHGHRGPLESDVMRPRFAELRGELRAALERGPAPTPADRPQPSVLAATLLRPLFLLDEAREAFRDRLMCRWQVLRSRILEEAGKAVAAGHLGDVDDVFFLRADDLAADPSTWRGRVVDRKAKVEAARDVDLPATGSRDAIEAALSLARSETSDAGPARFTGIGLGQNAVTGTAVRADALTELLARATLPESPVLVVDTLEPSWAVVFPRFAAVVTDLGGELSHASILLREAGIPAVVNARGAFRAVADGDVVRVDPAWGEVRVEARRAAVGLAGA